MATVTRVLPWRRHHEAAAPVELTPLLASYRRRHPKAPVAYRLGASFVPVRKAGKLPWAVVREEYQLEYGTDRLEIHRDAIHPDERILVVDDVLATGGTAAATCRLVEALGGAIVGIGILIELSELEGRAALGERRLEALASY